jgi:hypothetical protein
MHTAAVKRGFEVTGLVRSTGYQVRVTALSDTSRFCKMSNIPHIKFFLLIFKS